MKQSLKILCCTFLMVALLDVLVGQVLGWAARNDKAGSLVQYFEYGRSVPGKLAQWQAGPDIRGNLFETAWRETDVSASKAEFDDESADLGPVIRSYGMSFVNRILRQAVELDPNQTWDSHAGPNAPPNYTYAMFEDDRENRRAGDVVVLGILSSRVPAMAALSNRSWSFEQPAPFTYPVYIPEGGELTRIDPIVTSAAQERGLAQDPKIARAWRDQQRTHDAFYSWRTHGATWLDRSPFMRLVRRSAMSSHLNETETDIIQANSYPYREALHIMIESFAATVRLDDQRPVVMLVQSREQADVDLLALAKPILDANNIPYFATAEHFDPRQQSGFLADGHYQPTIDRAFGEQFLKLIAK
ncbi:MAG: hypothetical protein ABJL99_27180 [Aliishimia sp.]